MKRNKLFGFIFVVLTLCLFVGCPPTGPVGDNFSDPPPEMFGNCDVTPDIVEDIPADVSIMIEAKEKLIQEGSLSNSQIAFFYYRPDGNYTNWALWMWADGGDGNNNYKAFAAAGYSVVEVGDNKVGYMKFNNDGSTAGGAIPLTGEELGVIQKKGNFNFIVVQDKDGVSPNWDTKDYPKDLYWDIMQSNFFGVVTGSGNVYSIERNAKPRICGAVMLEGNGLRVQLSQKYALYPVAYSSGFYLVNENGKKVKVTDAYSYAYYGDSVGAYEREDNFTSNIYMEIEDGMDLSKKWFIKHPKFIPSEGFSVSTGAAIKGNYRELKYEGDDLGVTYNENKASFKVFAPMASVVNVVLFKTYDDAKAAVNNAGKQSTKESLKGAKRIKMTIDSATGVWSALNVDITGYTYYVYEIVNLGKTYRVCDINAKVAGPDSIAAQLIDINDASCKPDGWETSYTNPFGNSGSDTKPYTDAVIYEMHIRDWSKAVDSNKLGKFDDITEGLGTNGDGVLGQHLKDLGITHVQILPMFDYAQKNADDKYNWGYNPYHYNVPEGRYVNNHDNGGNEAVKQMRAMIKAFHDAGIAVNMDVVYNHTDGTRTGSLYDMTIPYYYYRLSNGEYSNGSGCGNETDSSAPMYRKYIIDSMKHWMTDYHINGFRFDLMGLHETDAMKEIYDAVSQIDKNVMVYGEPWTGGGSPVVSGVDKKKIDKCSSSTDVNGVACFNDDFRNAIKGGEFGGFEQGQVQGTYNSTKIAIGLQGSLTSKDGFTKKLGRSLNYVECHDNYTLFDKLDISIKNGTGINDYVAFDELSSAEKASVIAQDKLAAAYVFLAQGTPFINGGQEFMRTKQGDENSYVSSDEVNGIDMTFKNKFEDVYKVYKGLIAVRKQLDCFRGNYKSITVNAPGSGVTKYCITTSDDEIITVLFNAKNEVYTANIAEKFKSNEKEPIVRAREIDVKTGSVIFSDEDLTSDTIEAKDFKIYQFFTE